MTADGVGSNEWPSNRMVSRLANFRPFLVTLLCIGVASPVLGQDLAEGYSDADALDERLDDLRREHPNLVRLETITTSPGGHAIRAVTLGAGSDLSMRPALLIVANAFGPHVVGSEVAVRVASGLAQSYGSDPEIAALLDGRTLYVIPRANPDAAEAMFSVPARERAGNDVPSDDDRDWRVDEDGPEDLNGDGLITQMRVSDPAGEWLADPANPSLMRRADRAKGESGAYRLYTEGRDDDADESFNEDPGGGVDVNSNFSYDYEFFAVGAGDHQMSSAEAKAIADFVVEHENIAAVYVLGPQDNLLTPWEHKASGGTGGNAEGTRRGGPYSSILKPDEPFFAYMAERFRELVGSSGAPDAEPVGGDVLSWAYYHMGRWAFGSQTWWIPTEKSEDGQEAADGEEPEAEEEEGADEGVEGDEAEDDPEEHESLKREYVAYRWLMENRPAGFVQWSSVEHPDFPDRQVEVGGFAPFVRMNPPASLLDSIAEGHRAFVVELARALPAISFRDVQVENVGARSYRVTTEIANDGYFPTLSAMGIEVFWPRRLRVELQTDGQEVIGGRAVQLLDAIDGSGASSELSWLVVGPPGSRVTLSAESPVAGSISRTVTLR